MPPCFHYTLDNHGWASVTLVIDSHPYDFSHSYTSDPLTPLARAAAALARGHRLYHTAAIFDLERDGYLQLSLQECDPTLIRLARFPSDQRPEGHRGAGETVAEGLIDSVELAASVGAALDALLRSYGITGYARRWQAYFPFPMLEYIQLRLLLDTSPAAAQFAHCDPHESHARELALLATPPVWSEQRLGGRTEPARP